MTAVITKLISALGQKDRNLRWLDRHDR